MKPTRQSCTRHDHKAVQSGRRQERPRRLSSEHRHV